MLTTRCCIKGWPDILLTTTSRILVPYLYQGVCRSSLLFDYAPVRARDSCHLGWRFVGPRRPLLLALSFDLLLAALYVRIVKSIMRLCFFK